MANCTIISEINDKMPVYSPIVFVVDSTDKLKCRFKYVCEIYVSKDSWYQQNNTFTKVATMKEFPNPDGYGEFDIHRILENYITHDLNGTAIGGAANPNSYVWYIVNFGVEFDDTIDCSGAVTFYNNIIDYQGIAWNGAFQYDDFPNFMNSTGVADVFELTNSTKRFLTNHPSTGVTIAENQTYQLSYFNYGVNYTTSLFVVDAYDSSGNLINSTSSDTDTEFPLDVGQDLISIGVGTYNLAHTTPSTGSSPILPDNTAYYLVHIQGLTLDLLGLVPVSESLRFNIDRTCSKYDPITLTWLNRWGGFDTFTFTGKSVRTVPVKKTLYDKVYGKFFNPLWGWGSGGSGEGGTRGRTTLSVKASDKTKLSTGWISDEEATWLEELFTSPQVFIAGQTVHFNNPVNVTSTSYEEKKTVNTKMISYTIEIESATDKTIQRA